MDCIFCAPGEPCSSHAPKSSKAVKKRAPRRAAVTPPAPVVAQAPEPVIYYSGPPTGPDALVRATIEKKRNRFSGMADDEPDVDLDTREAIYNLWDMLSPQTQRKHSHVIDRPKNAALSKRQSEVRRTLNEVQGSLPPGAA